MKPRVWLSLLVVAAAGAAVWQLVTWRNLPPEVPFAKAVREAITSSISTNGKVEPIESAAARAERSGAVSRIAVQRGDRVMQGQVLVEIATTEARAEVATAQARIQAVQAEIETLTRGGKSVELADITSSIEKARLDVQQSQAEYDRVTRLQAKQAATKVEADAAKARLEQAQLLIKSLEERRRALVAPADLAAAQARLREAQVQEQLAQSKIEMSTVRSPLTGVLYQFDLKPGAYLTAGDIVGLIGRLERVQANVFVDEPDLGRVKKGLAVMITWDALPGRQWMGTVDKLPTQIVTLGARQVGEVVATIQNPDMDLIPGTNVNVAIVVETVDKAVTIPKEAIRRENGVDGVYLLEGNALLWKPVTIGVNNTTRAQVKELEDGASIALPTEVPLAKGLTVRPIFQ